MRISFDLGSIFNPAYVFDVKKVGSIAALLRSISSVHGHDVQIASKGKSDRALLAFVIRDICPRVFAQKRRGVEW